MEVIDLKNQIRSNTLDSLYIFTGPERVVMQVYLDEMSRVSNMPIKYLDSYEESVKVLNARTLVLSSQICILRDDKYVISSDKIISDLMRFSSSNVLVLIYTAIDKRSKFYKTFKDKIITFEYLDEGILTRYIQKYIELSNGHCKQLIQSCENDYNRVLLEIDKLKQLKSKYTERTYDMLFREAYDDGTIYKSPKDAVFDFVDAVLKRRPQLAFDLLEESYASGEATLVLISNLYNNAKWLLQYQSFIGNRADLSAKTGLSSFQIKLASQRINNYSNGELVEMMKTIRWAERGIKLGDIEDRIAMEYILVNVL